MFIFAFVGKNVGKNYNFTILIFNFFALYDTLNIVDITFLRKIKMYILLQNQNKTFVPYNRNLNPILLEYTGTISENHIINWLKKQFNMDVIKAEINTVNKNVIAVVITLCNDTYQGEFVTFSKALKLLSDDEFKEVRDYIEHQKIKTNIKLKYGIRNGKIICINEISEQEKGLKCNCICPGCGMPLQAKLGQGKKQRHFSHNNKACDTVIAHQSALHLLAKEIIEEEGKICLPPLTVRFNESPKIDIDRDYYDDLPQEIVYKESKIINCDNVILEKKISDIIPDVIIETLGKQCLVEIAVTHFIDEEKNEKIRQLGLPVIEVDLSSVYESEITREEIRKILIEKPEFKTWIYNPKKKEAIRWAGTRYTEIYREILQKEIENKKLQKLFEQEREAKRDKTRRKMDELSMPENYRKAVLKLRNDNLFFEIFKKRKFFKENLEPPFYIDIPITGEMVFNCDRRIWQSAIFDKFIYNRKDTELGNPTIHVQKIVKWITTYQDEFKLDWDLVPKTFLFIKNSGYSRSLLHECIKQYLEYMSLLGFLSALFYREAKVMSTYNLIPPNQENATQLATILKKVNQYSWDVTEEIYALLFPHKVYLNSYAKISKDSDDEKFSYEISEIKRKQVLESNKLRYDSGLQEVLDKNLLNSDELAKDSFGYRWLVCTECGQIKREDEMASYCENTGLCRDCSKKHISTYK